MINLEYYKIFYHVAKRRSITLAAEELFITQPAVSQAIRQLEQAIGSTLFIRTPKGVQLTPEGEVLHNYISQGYELMALGESKFKELLNLEAGEIRIGASDMTLQFYLLSYLEAFHKKYPKIKIKVTNGPTPETMDYLNSGKIDFAVVSSPVDAYAGVHVKPVAVIKDVFVAGDRFADLKGREVSLSELQHYPIIGLEQNTSTRKYVDRFLKEHGTVLNLEFELATSHLIIEFAARNLGIGLVVRDFAEEMLKKGQLFELQLDIPIPSRSICVVTNEKMPTSPAGRKLLDMLNT
ncbi:MAG: LysR family transcriptional regulator [Clostridia bacterium]|nr:LysR family transcriptional regulator [Clostridia bacterium]